MTMKEFAKYLPVTIVYKGYCIEYNFYGNNEFSIQFCGDDIIFNNKEDAYNFIDNLEKEGVNNEN